jgi:hypothetical protein
MRNKKTLIFLSVIILITISCNSDNTVFRVDEEKYELTFSSSIQLNEIQILGTHNSYAKPIDTALLNYLDPLIEKMMQKNQQSQGDSGKMAAYNENHPHTLKMSEMLSYHHPPFDEQLNDGIRSFEIDVYYDPTGNRFTKPAGHIFLRDSLKKKVLPFDSTKLLESGFKVLHIADVDFRTQYATLKEALIDLKSWSDKNSNHVPLFIMIEVKEQGFPVFPNASKVLPFTKQAFDELDKVIISALGKEKIITPDMVRGEYKTLEEAVLARNWPSLKKCIGKFIFMLLPTTASLNTETPYLTNGPSLEKRVMFLLSEPGYPHSAILLFDNAIVRKDDIQQAVKKGYLVRTRADIDTYEAKMNDHTRAKAAFKSGAQVVSTDYFKPGNFYATEYYVSMPNGKPVRINPLFEKK